MESNELPKVSICVGPMAAVGLITLGRPPRDSVGLTNYHPTPQEVQMKDKEPQADVKEEQAEKEGAQAEKNEGASDGLSTLMGMAAIYRDCSRKLEEKDDRIEFLQAQVFKLMAKMNGMLEAENARLRRCAMT